MVNFSIPGVHLYLSNQFVIRNLFLHFERLSRNRIGGVLVSVFVSSVVDRGYEHQSVQSKEYTIGICRFFKRFRHFHFHSNSLSPTF